MDDQMDCDHNLEKNQVVPVNAMNVDQDETVIGGTKVEIANKGKAKLVYDETWQNQIKDCTMDDLATRTSISVESIDALKRSTSGSVNSNNHNGSNIEPSSHNGNDDGDVDDGCDYACDTSDYGSDKYMYEEDDDDEYSAMQSKYDNVDLPPGVEASVPWLMNDLASTQNNASSVSSTSGINVTVPDLVESKIKEASMSSLTVQAESNSTAEQEHKNAEVMQQFLEFKLFDTMEDFSDHNFSNMGSKEGVHAKEWAKKIQAEWKILEKNLPDSIFVRAYEARMDLLRAVIVGPSGTPYHDGLFVFDCYFPPTYPAVPPTVHYYSGGLRLNPNLYNCGKVCLSLLGTWPGKPTEMWNPKQSTMLQVLVSIQALILNAEPFFNEPGYEASYKGEAGKKKSEAYNEDVYILSLKTMIYTMRRPPKHFEDLVAGHFRSRARDILLACKAYMEGALVGSVVVKNGVVTTTNSDERIANSSADFKAKLFKLINAFVQNFTKNGSTDVEEFRIAP